MGVQKRKLSILPLIIRLSSRMPACVCFVIRRLPAGVSLFTVRMKDFDGGAEGVSEYSVTIEAKKRSFQAFGSCEKAFFFFLFASKFGRCSGFQISQADGLSLNTCFWSVLRTQSTPKESSKLRLCPCPPHGLFQPIPWRSRCCSSCGNGGKRISPFWSLIGVNCTLFHCDSL
ncbi:hypothetical protein B0T20DRAFT_219566 [Sordaria brevicollis]|uniref:Uncharacterized protein n=1 Tax=Sordaria brevicollis TaxID=83679 RepID=A0AAE0PFI4_SORBR|nr:hypothetical protein B0T20DRAFT_219566 [Sordaria brevicollis]